MNASELYKEADDYITRMEIHADEVYQNNDQAVETMYHCLDSIRNCLLKCASSRVHDLYDEGAEPNDRRVLNAISTTSQEIYHLEEVYRKDIELMKAAAEARAKLIMQGSQEVYEAILLA